MLSCERIEPSPVERLLQDPRIWQAGRTGATGSARLASGWHDLDRMLGGGWPLGELTELHVSEHGMGEISLLLPALALLTRKPTTADSKPRWVTLVAPPYMPYAPALAEAGLNLTRLLVVHARQDLDTLWAIEQALHSKSCGAVIGWSDTREETALRRLQLAAESSGVWLVLFRSTALRRLRSPAPLRIELRHAQQGRRLVLHVFKRRGGSPASADLQPA